MNLAFYHENVRYPNFTRLSLSVTECLIVKLDTLSVKLRQSLGCICWRRWLFDSCLISLSDGCLLLWPRNVAGKRSTIIYESFTTNLYFQSISNWLALERFIGQLYTSMHKIRMRPNLQICSIIFAYGST